jgi:lipoprotein-anchoring transpeptidase ErfK/SrfK
MSTMAGVVGGLLCLFLAISGVRGSTPAPAITPATTPAAGGSSPTAAPGKTLPSVPVTPSNTPLIATARVASLAVYMNTSDRHPSQVLPNPWFVQGNSTDPVPQVFGVVKGTTRVGWVHILLPVRPNGTTAWVHADDVTLNSIFYHVTVHLKTHTLVATSGHSVILTDKVAVGKSSTPTPTGHYYIRVLFQATDPNTVYGPWDFGLSAHSDALSSFDGSDAEIGIHGNDDASVLGFDVTHGCVRMSNDGITKLAGILPLGTPVDILP